MVGAFCFRYSRHKIFLMLSFHLFSLSSNTFPVIHCPLICTKLNLHCTNNIVNQLFAFCSFTGTLVLVGYICSQINIGTDASLFDQSRLVQKKQKECMVLAWEMQLIKHRSQKHWRACEADYRKKMVFVHVLLSYPFFLFLFSGSIA